MRRRAVGAGDEPVLAGAVDAQDEVRVVLAWAVAVALAGVLLIGLLSWIGIGENVIGAGSGSYLLVFALVVGDAVFPVLPGETTLTTGSIVAANGDLTLAWVILAGGLGAVVGDSCAYWGARLARGRWRDKLMRSASQPKARVILDVFADRAPMMIVFGRYVPGVRFAINVTMGSVVRLPYPRFLAWSAIAGFVWSTYTCVLAYGVATALENRPFASIVISSLVTTAALVVIGASLRRGVRRASRTSSSLTGTGS